MSTEYRIVIEGSCSAEYHALLNSSIAELKSDSVTAGFEEKFSSFDDEVKSRVHELLTTYADLFFCVVAMTERDGRFRWMWEGYGDGDAFMVKLLQFFDLLGLEMLSGESHGDEEIYCCRVTEDSIDCEYVER